MFFLESSFYRHYSSFTVKNLTDEKNPFKTVPQEAIRRVQSSQNVKWLPTAFGESHWLGMLSVSFLCISLHPISPDNSKEVSANRINQLVLEKQGCVIIASILCQVQLHFRNKIWTDTNNDSHKGSPYYFTKSNHIDLIVTEIYKFNYKHVIFKHISKKES